MIMFRAGHQEHWSYDAMTGLRVGGGYRQVRRNGDQDWILRRAWRMETRRQESPWTAHQRDRVYVTMNNHAEPVRLAEPNVTIERTAMQRALQQASSQL